MKKLLILMIISCAFTANAQNYLISFAGTGAATTINSIKVENLSTGISVLLTGNDILRLTASTGIESLDHRKPQSLVIYPNPSDYSSKIEIFPPSSGESTISLYDMSGKKLSQTRFYLDLTGYEFSIDGLGKGFYMVEVKGRDYRLSGKLMSTGQSGREISINKTGDPVREIILQDKIRDIKAEQATVDMSYTAGDRLMFTAVSGNYETVVTDIPSTDKTITFNFIACTDGGGNHYPVVQIGSAKGDGDLSEDKGVQTWMAENLKAVKYNDGTNIPLVTDATAWLYLTSPGYCWYNNDETGYKDLYGGLYNYHAVKTGKLCPAGWHVPSQDEWITMMDYLIANGFNYDGTTTGNKISKALASTSGWKFNTQPGTPGNTDYPSKRNASGFTSMPGGYRVSMTGAPFSKAGEYSYWWTSTERPTSYAYYRLIMFNTPDVTTFDYNVKMGMSVRCIKD